MAEQQTADTDADKGSGQQQQQEPPPRTFTQDEVNAILAGRKAADRDVLQKAKQFDELQEKSKTDLQREQDARAQAEKERDEARTGLLRLSVAAKKGLDPDAAEFISGTDEESMTASADKLLKLAGKNPPDFDAGRRNPPPAAGGDMNEIIRTQAGFGGQSD